MPRSDLDVHFAKIDSMVLEIDNLVPPDSNYRAVQFRADLAGLLVVMMAATYETCVKEVLIDYADKHHAAFGNYARRSYEKINSHVRIKDLLNYCDVFDPSIRIRFRDRLRIKEERISYRIGSSVKRAYEQILDWRNDFAHTGNRSTTVEEAMRMHTLGKRILYLFDDAFHRPD